MSEYQYYEFLAIDRPLTAEEQRAVARLSSRVDPHPRRAAFVYNWSDFPGQAGEVLARYYDAMLYMANWGSRRLAFRFPKKLVNPEQMTQYRVKTLDYPSDIVDVFTVGKHVVLDIQVNDESAGDWIDGEGWLDALVGLRGDILQGDYRALYLAWLKGLTVEYDVDEEALEPPLPPGLSQLTPPLEDFVDFIGVDDELMEVAAAQSGEVEAASEGKLRRAIAALPGAEKDAFLLRLAQDEPLLSLALKQHLGLTGAPAGETGSRRTVGELRAAAEALRARQRQEQAARAEARRTARMEALAQRKEAVWQEVDELVQTYKPKAYDEATRLLGQLKELAAYQGQTAAFQDRLDQLCQLYHRRRSLLSRLRRAGLYAGE